MQTLVPSLPSTSSDLYLFLLVSFELRGKWLHYLLHHWHTPHFPPYSLPPHLHFLILPLRMQLDSMMTYAFTNHTYTIGIDIFPPHFTLVVHQSHSASHTLPSS